MPDITMCSNEECPIKVRCFRYNSKPDLCQSYAVFEYRNGECDNFIFKGWDKN